MSEKIPHYDVRHDGYDGWLIESRVKETATGQLLHALVCREVRAELHRRWRAGCNPIVVYTDALDLAFNNAVANHLAERIDAKERA